jgi:ectoine hydroxylase-related dioxygenase (phytanoyl-CoA dioxygenase family)
MTHSLRLSGQQIAQFLEEGFLVVPGFYDLAHDIEPIQRGIHEIIGQVMKRHGVQDRRPAYSPAEFDAQYQALIAENRSWGAQIYDAVKQIPAFSRLVSHPANEAVMRQLRPGSIPGIAGHGAGIRIDNPQEHRFKAQWHQEYPAQLRSLDGVVFWSPLVPITAETGPVQFCPGSHREGPLPVFTPDTPEHARSGAYAIMLKDEAELLGRYPKVAPLSKPGDLIVADFLVLHASGDNRAARSRWSMQFRYFNFADETGRRLGWPGSFTAGFDFRKVHPELFVN